MPFNKKKMEILDGEEGIPSLERTWTIVHCEKITIEGCDNF